jgi:hypothetical protein
MWIYVNAVNIAKIEDFRDMRMLVFIRYEWVVRVGD